MPLRPRRAMALSVLIMVVLGCRTTAHQAYRDRQCEARQVQDARYDSDCFSPNSSETGLCSTERHGGYELAYLEFDDQGEYFYPCQLDRANFLVDQANERAKEADPRTGGAVVVVFVHGWRNNASEFNEREGNLASFKQALAELADLEASCEVGAQEGQRKRCPPPRPVVGIYVAWRGDYLQTVAPLRRIDWLFDWATFWNRDAAAQRIASRPIATQALLLLLENVKAENQNARVIAVGHSMGALLLEQAMSQALVTRFIDNLFEKRFGPEVSIRPLADLVVFVNSAAQALRAQSLVDTLQIRKVTFDLQPMARTTGQPPPPPEAESGPLLISLTARNDNATGWLFPKALTISTRRQKFQLQEEADLDGRPTQKYLARHTSGHTPQLFSHKELSYSKERQPCTAKPGTWSTDGTSFSTASTEVIPCSDSSIDGTSIAFAVHSKSGGFNTYRLLRDSGTLNKSLYWILQVPPEVIDGHSKIFQEPFRDFLRGLIVVTGAANRYYERTLETPPNTSRSVRPEEPDGSQ